MITVREIGTLDLPNGKVDITDPAYDKSTYSRINAMPVKPGIYHCFSHEYREDDQTPDDYPRIAATHIVHASVKERLMAEDPNLVWVPYNIIGVDAGMAGYFPDKPDFDDDQWNEFCNVADRNERENQPAFICEHGFLSHSGYGDGGYPVDVLVDTTDGVADDILEDDVLRGLHEKLGVRITFIDPDAEDD